ICDLLLEGQRRERRSLRRPVQYIFFGSSWLRRRLCSRFTAAAALRLRSVVGFSKCSRARNSVSSPVFSTVRLKRRNATSNGSFSLMRTVGITWGFPLGNYERRVL